MNELEIKNLETQLSLCKDIIEGEGMITHLIQHCADNAFSILKNKKLEEGKIEITEDDLLSIKDALWTLSDKSNFHSLATYAEKDYLVPIKIYKDTLIKLSI
jgi:hypothetical protein